MAEKIAHSWISTERHDDFLTAYASVEQGRVMLMKKFCAEMPGDHHPLKALLSTETRVGTIKKSIDAMPTYTNAKQVISHLGLQDDLDATPGLHMVIFAPSDLLIKTGATFTSHDTVLGFSVFHNKALPQIQVPKSESKVDFGRDDGALVSVHQTQAITGLPVSIACRLYAYNPALSSNNMHVFGVCAMSEGVN